MAKTAVSGGKIHTAAGDAPIIPVLLIGIGGYLMWFGVKYWRGQGPAVWPSYPVKSVLQGHGIPSPKQAPTATAQLTAYETQLGQQSGQGGGTGGNTPSVPQGKIQNMARLLLGKMGWSGQWQAFANVENREAGWNPRARNPSSGALGLAQALGHGGTDTAGSLGNEYGAEYGLTVTQARAANSGNALQQLRWMMGYIRQRYGSPAGAWAHEQAFGWYMHGGVIPPGKTGVVGEQEAEYVTALPGGGVEVTPGAPSSPGEA